MLTSSELVTGRNHLGVEGGGRVHICEPRGRGGGRAEGAVLTAHELGRAGWGLGEGLGVRLEGKRGI